jgi:hypothetical protein
LIEETGGEDQGGMSDARDVVASIKQVMRAPCDKRRGSVLTGWLQSIASCLVRGGRFVLPRRC